MTSQLAPEQQKILQLYCDGVNAYIESMWFPPLEFLLANVKIEPLVPEDILVTLQLSSFVGLSQLQSDAEKFVIQLIHNSPDLESILDRVKDLFPTQTKGLTKELAEEIRKITYLENSKIPQTLFKHFNVGEVTGSNNWVVSGKHTESGSPLMAMDPHLQINRLPSVFYEVIFRMGSEYAMFISLPGIPGTVMGRSNDVASSFTYGMMDQADYFIEQIQNGKVLRNGKFVDLIARTEKIHQRSGSDVNTYFYETPDGCTLEIPNNYPSASAIPDGYYLSFKWSWELFESKFLNILSFKFHHDAESLMETVRYSPTSCNFIVADTKGTIAYQQSGLAPNRKNKEISSFLPIPGWEEGNVWNSLIPAEDLLQIINPEQGFIVTANHDVEANYPNLKERTISVTLGGFRYERGTAVLNDYIKNGVKLNRTHMQKLQLDDYSLQAEQIMSVLKQPGLLPSTRYTKELLDWDYRFHPSSRGALLYRMLYEKLLEEILADNLDMTQASFGYAFTNTTLEVVLSHFLDRAITSFAPDSLWYGSEGRDKLIYRVASEVLSDSSTNPWIASDAGFGKAFMPLTFTNIFFQGKLPKWTGFDVGSFEQKGTHQTLYCGHFRTSHGVDVNVAAAWRAITDLSENNLWSILAGGPSGKRFSQYYISEIADYHHGNLKLNKLA